MNGRVAVWTAPRAPFEIREYPVADPEADSILVRMRVCNICGSDLHLWHGDTVPFEPGQVLGHEMVGTIEKIGHNVKTDSLGQPLSEGDRIIYAYARHCGTCRYCLTREAPCPTRNSHWIKVSSETAPHFHAGYGEFYFVRPGQPVFKVADSLSDDLVSPVNCAGAQVAEAMHRVTVRAGDSVIVQGAGGLGLYAATMAREAGARQVIMFDGYTERLEFAQQFGATHFVNISEITPEDRQAQVLEWTDNLGADIAFEFAGVPAAVAEGITLLRQGGQYLVAGNISGKETTFDPTNIVRRCLTVQGLHGYEAGAIPRSLNFLQRTQNKYPYEKMISHHFGFEEINDAFALADRGEGVRVSIDF